MACAVPGTIGALPAAIAAVNVSPRNGTAIVLAAPRETRNLPMASNIREAMAVYPGQRMLVVVGTSHKWYLEACLNQMHDVRIADALPLLR